MPPLRVLLISEDVVEAEALRRGLAARDLDVHVVHGGMAAATLARRLQPEVVVIDLGLRSVDAAETCRTLLDECAAPVVGLANSSDPGGRAAFLDAGGHGYVNKPVNHRELAALIRTHAHQRGDAQRPAILRGGTLAIDLAAMEARRDGEALDLTPIEMNLLLDLVGHAGQLRTYDDLSRAAWDGNGADRHTIHNHIAHLRAKIEPGRRDHSQIEPVTGMGYRFRPAADRPRTCEGTLTES